MSALSGQWAVHGDIWEGGQSYCAFCDMLGHDHGHEHFVIPNGVDRYRWHMFRNARANVATPPDVQNVVRPLADRTLEEDDVHWVRWALGLTAPGPSERVREKAGPQKIMAWRAREVYQIIHTRAWVRSQRGRWGLRRLPTHEVVERLLRSLE